MATTNRVFISVAEDSADRHAAALVRRVRVTRPDLSFYGLTGPRLRAEGVETLADQTAHAAMLSGVFGVFGRALKTVRRVEECWRRERPAAVVLLDSPELHLGIYELGLKGLAGRAKRLGIPVLYYIAPQTWASRAYRNRWIAGDVDRLACILPFEPAYFARAGVRAEFVGHPLFETLPQEPIEAGIVAELRAAERPVVALLPGSRRGVIEAMLPRQLEILRRLNSAGHACTGVVSCAHESRRAQIDGCIARSGVRVRVLVDQNATLLSAADLALVASGTATLQVAYYRKPMIVMYDAGPILGPLFMRFGRRVVTTPHLSLVNLLAGRRIVPEFMPHLPDVGPVATVAGQLLKDGAWRAEMARDLDQLVRPLEGGDASGRVAEMLGEMVG